MAQELPMSPLEQFNSNFLNDRPEAEVPLQGQSALDDFNRQFFGQDRARIEQEKSFALEDNFDANGAKDASIIAKDSLIEKESGVNPSDVAQSLPKRAELMRLLGTTPEQFASQYPRLTKGFIDDSTMLAIAKHDIGRLKKLEDTLREYAPSIDDDGATTSWSSNEMAYDKDAKTWLAGSVQGAIGNLGSGLLGAMQFLAESAYEVSDARFLRDMSLGIKESQGQLKEWADNQFRAGTKDFGTGASWIAGGAQSGFMNVATFSTGLALAALVAATGGTAAPAIALWANLGLMGLTSFGNAYSEGKQQGLSTLAAGGHGLAQGGLEVATEFLPQKFLGDALGTKAILKNLTPENKQFVQNVMKYTFTDVAGEQVNTILGGLESWAVLPENQDKTFIDFLSELPEDMAQTFVATLVGSGVTVTAGAALSNAVGQVEGTLANRIGRDFVRQNDALRGMAVIKTIDEIAANAEVANVAPEMLPGLISKAVGDGVQTAYLDSQVFFQKPELRAQIVDVAPELANSIDSAVANGQDIEMSVETLTKLIQSETMRDVLYQDVRLKKDGITPRQAQENLMQLGEDAKRIFDESLNNVAAERRVVLEKIQGDIANQMVAAGYTRNNAQLQGQLWSSFINAMAERVDMDPDALYEKYKPTIRNSNRFGEVPKRIAVPKTLPKRTVERQARVRQSGAGTKRATFAPTAVTSEKPVIIQNRDRSRPGLVAQMHKIAASPNYQMVSFSRDFGNGAPVVAYGAVSENQLGREDFAVTAKGESIRVRYAVVEADSVLTSNNVDGTVNPEYNNADASRMRAIAGNGRIAGLQEAFNRNTTTQYVEAMKADADTTGIDASVIDSMQKPILVRIMPPENVTADIGDVSNTSTTAQLSDFQQANNDAERLNFDRISFTEDGAIDESSVIDFIQQMPVSEQDTLITKNGRPTQRAYDRLTYALIAKAYQDDELTQLATESTGEEARNVFKALVAVAPKYVRLLDSEYDLRDVIAGVAHLAIDAQRKGVSLESHIGLSGDLDLGDAPVGRANVADPSTIKVAQEVAKVTRSYKSIQSLFSTIADEAFDEMVQADSNETDMFGGAVARSRDDVVDGAILAYQSANAEGSLFQGGTYDDAVQSAKNRIGYYLEEARQHKLVQAQEQRTDNLGKKVYLKVSPVEIEEAAKYGLDLSKKRFHMIDASNLGHSDRRHGKMERRADQIPLTEEDYLRIPEVVAYPDLVGYETKDKYENDAIVYVKEFDDGTFVIVEETVKHGVLLKTVWKKAPGALGMNVLIDAMKTHVKPTSVTTPGNTFFTSSIEQNPKSRNAGNYMFYQNKLSFDDSLVTLHNITENGLLKAANLGGLPAPSIAVSKASSPLQQFGDITLVGTKDLADPKKNPVFSVDAYTKRFPKLDWSKSLKKEDARELRHVIELAQEQVGGNAGDNRVTYYLFNRPNRDMAIEKLTDSAAGIAMFLNHKGIPFKPIRKKAKREWGVNDNTIAAYKAIEKKFGSVDVSEQNESRKIFAKAMFDWAKSRLDSGGSSFGYINKILDGIVTAYESDPYLSNGSARKVDLEDFVESVRRYFEESKRLSYQFVIDEVATKELLEKKIARYQGEYEQYIQERVSEAFGNPGIVDGEKIVPLTLENVVRAMTRGEVRGAEGGFASNVSGAIRAKASKQYESMEDLQSDRERVVNRDESWESEKEVDSKIDEFISSVAKYWKYSTSSFGMEDLDGARNVLVKCAQNPTVANLKRALKNEGFEGVDDETIQKGIDALMSAKQVLTDYLEVKPQRAVAFSEFAGAVVPNTISQEARAVLENAGIEIQTYNPKLEGGRVRAQQRLMKRLQKERGDILFQEDGTDPRGAYDPATRAISLFRSQNMSTFLHESGHAFLDIMIDLAGMENAPADLLRDVQTLLDWFGVENIDAWNALDFEAKTACHEKFARGFESYLRQGKAPSTALGRAFSRFKKWLVTLYKSAKELNVDVTPQVKEVMDRMLASEAEITQAQSINRLANLWTQENFPGTPTQWEQYQALSKDGDDVARAQHNASLLAEMAFMRNRVAERRAELDRQFNEEYEKARQQAAKELNEDPVYQMIRDFQGENKPKLSSVEVAQIGDDQLQAVGAHGILADDGYSLEPMAQTYGYGEDVVTFVEVIAGTKPFDQAVENRAREIMGAENEELLTEAQRQESAELAALNDLTLRRVEEEYKVAAANKAKADVRTAAKEWAAETIDNTVVRLLNQNQYRVQAEKFARVAIQAAAQHNSQAVAEAKRKQLVNLYAQRESLKAKNRVHQTEKLARSIKRSFKKKLRKGQQDQEFMDQVLGLLHGYGLLEGDYKTNRTFAEFKADFEDKQGVPLSMIDESLFVNTGRNYKDLTYAEFATLRDAIDMLLHQGRRVRTVIREGHREAIEKIVERLDGEIVDKFDATVPTEKNRLKEAVKGYLMDHMKLSNLVRKMVGGKHTSTLHQVILDPLNQAGEREVTMIREAADKLNKLTNEKLGKSSMTAKVKIISGKGAEMLTLSTRLAIALNCGNRQNRERLESEANGMTKGSINAVLSSLTKSELEWVQGVWDLIDSYWPMIAEVERRTNGLPPQKIEAEPFDVVMPDNSVVAMKGGYYPIKYDSGNSIDAARNEMKNYGEGIVKGAFGSATTKQGFAKKRSEGVDRKLDLDLFVIGSHLKEVIHDICFRETLQEINRLARNGDFARLVQDRFGAEYYRHIVDTIMAVATDGSASAMRPALHPALQFLKGNVTFAALSASVTTVFLQPLGILQSIQRIGFSNVLNGYVKLAKQGSLVNIEKTCLDKSEFMRNRKFTMNAELNEIGRRLQQSNNRFVRGADAVEKVLFAPMQGFQVWTVDLPTWYGAYQMAWNAGASEEEAVKIADQTVRDSQGSGLISDQSPFQRNHPLMTVFYSYFSSTLNLVADSWNENVLSKRTVGGSLLFVRDLMMLTAVPTIVTELVFSLLRGDDWDDREPEDWAKLGVSATVGSVLSMFVGLREFTSILNGYTYTGPIVGRVVNDAGRLGYALAAEDPDASRIFQSSMSLMSNVIKIPATQINRTWRGIEAYMEGESEMPTSVLFGPPKQ